MDSTTVYAFKTDMVFPASLGNEEVCQFAAQQPLSLEWPGGYYSTYWLVHKSGKNGREL